jgi:hypothetical protein
MKSKKTEDETGIEQWINVGKNVSYWRTDI